MRPATLSDYRWLYQHTAYMPSALACAQEILSDIAFRCPATFIDWGCGRGQLVDWINSQTSGRCVGIDPATRPGQFTQAQYVISCDVLEHISEDQIPATLSLLCSMAGRGLLFTIANMSDVHKVNGEQVELHLTQQPVKWWTEKIRDCRPDAKITTRKINRDRFIILADFA